MSSEAMATEPSWLERQRDREDNGENWRPLLTWPGRPRAGRFYHEIGYSLSVSDWTFGVTFAHDHYQGNRSFGIGLGPVWFGWNREWCAS